MSEISPSSAPGAEELQRARAEVGRVRTTGRNTSEEDHRSAREIGAVNPTVDTTSGTSTSREKRRPDRSSLMWSRPILSPWYVYKQDLMKLNLQTVKFAAEAMRMLNGVKLSVSGLYSIVGVDWLIAAGTNFSSTMTLKFYDLEGQPSNNTIGPVYARNLQDVRMNLGE